MKKNGFTLMELLAVIMILAVVSVAATLSFGNIDNTTSVNELKNRYIEIQRAASLYVDLNDNETYLDELTGRNSSGITRVSVGTLKSNNYINDLSNPVTGEDIPLSTVVVLYIKENNHVDTCIISSENDANTLQENTSCVANSKGEWLDMPVTEDKTLLDTIKEEANEKVSRGEMTAAERDAYINDYITNFCCDNRH